MARANLRIYYGPEAACTSYASEASERSTVHVALGEILPLLVDAVRQERTWLDDFAGDEVAISADLYEVLLAYQHCRRPGA